MLQTRFRQPFYGFLCTTSFVQEVDESIKSP